MATSGQLGRVRMDGMFAGGMAPVTPVTGVQSISGNGVDNTDPAAPVINATADDTANTIVYRDANGQAEIAVPTDGPQIANKNYVDAQITIVNAALADKADAAAVVDLTTAQTVAGVKTFSAIPVLPAAAPTTGNQATNKTYVDTAITGVNNTINARLSLAQRTAINALVPATATAEDIVNALQAV